MIRIQTVVLQMETRVFLPRRTMAGFLMMLRTLLTRMAMQPQRTMHGNQEGRRNRWTRSLQQRYLIIIYSIPLLFLDNPSFPPITHPPLIPNPSPSTLYFHFNADNAKVRPDHEPCRPRCDARRRAEAEKGIETEGTRKAYLRWAKEYRA